MARISDAPPVVGLDGDELVLAQGDTGDVKVTGDQLAAFVKDSLTPAETLAKVIASNPQTNGLDANLLQGLTSTFLRNASNLNAGTVPEARLPFGEFQTSFATGGDYPQAGIFKAYWKLPTFLTGGPKLMIQFGHTGFVPRNNRITTTFLTPFSSGFGNENQPFMVVAPECRGTEWNIVGTGASQPEWDVELDMKLWWKDLNSFKCSSLRNRGDNADYVRANWLAIGYYV